MSRAPATNIQEPEAPVAIDLAPSEDAYGAGEAAAVDLRRVGAHPDHWYPIARSRQLKRRKPRAVTFAGQSIVLVRPDQGAPFALEDRCAHRQVPLSAGVVRDGRLICDYHAWEYEGDGRVARVPYLVKGGPRPPRCVRSFACREAYDHVWIFPGDQAKAGATPLPEIPYVNDRGYFTMFFSREVPCHYSFMHENLLDMNHQFLHRRLMGRVTAQLLASETGADFIEASYRLITSGKRDRGAKLMTRSGGKESADDFDVMTIRTQYPHQTLRIARKGKKPMMSLFAAYVPVGAEQRVHRSFGMLSIDKPPFGLIYAMYPLIRWFTEKVFAEDRWAVIAEQKAWDETGEDRNAEVFPVILDARRVLRENGVPLAAPTIGT